jgi:glycosyltransferase involved in cell wall biosynthesis
MRFFVSYLRRRPKLITRLHTARIFIDKFNGRSDRRGAAKDYWLEKRSICRADMITAPSQAILDLTKTWLKLNDDKTIVIPNPISIADFQRHRTIVRRSFCTLVASKLTKGQLPFWERYQRC